MSDLHRARTQYAEPALRPLGCLGTYFIDPANESVVANAENAFLLRNYFIDWRLNILQATLATLKLRELL
jgi:hypothetical protein